MLAVEYRSSRKTEWRTHLVRTDEFVAVADVLSWFDHAIYVRVVSLCESQLFRDALAELDECATMEDVDAVLELAYSECPELATLLRAKQRAQRGRNLIRFPIERVRNV